MYAERERGSAKRDMPLLTLRQAKTRGGASNAPSSLHHTRYLLTTAIKSTPADPSPSTRCLTCWPLSSITLSAPSPDMSRAVLLYNPPELPGDRPAAAALVLPRTVPMGPDDVWQRRRTILGCYAMTQVSLHQECYSKKRKETFCLDRCVLVAAQCHGRKCTW